MYKMTCLEISQSKQRHVGGRPKSDKRFSLDGILVGVDLGFDAPALVADFRLHGYLGGGRRAEDVRHTLVGCRLRLGGGGGDVRDGRQFVWGGGRRLGAPSGDSHLGSVCRHWSLSCCRRRRCRGGRGRQQDDFPDGVHLLFWYFDAA